MSRDREMNTWLAVATTQCVCWINELAAKRFHYGTFVTHYLRNDLEARGDRRLINVDIEILPSHLHTAVSVLESSDQDLFAYTYRNREGSLRKTNGPES